MKIEDGTMYLVEALCVPSQRMYLASRSPHGWTYFVGSAEGLMLYGVRTKIQGDPPIRVIMPVADLEELVIEHGGAS